MKPTKRKNPTPRTPAKGPLKAAREEGPGMRETCPTCHGKGCHGCGWNGNVYIWRSGSATNDPNTAKGKK